MQCCMRPGVCYVLKNYSKIKISSIGASTTREISTASLRDGLYCAFSSRIMVSRRTPTALASCSCVSPLARRNCFSLHIFVSLRDKYITMQSLRQAICGEIFADPFAPARGRCYTVCRCHVREIIEKFNICKVENHTLHPQKRREHSLLAFLFCVVIDKYVYYNYNIII